MGEWGQAGGEAVYSIHFDQLFLNLNGNVFDWLNGCITQTLPLTMRDVRHLVGCFELFS